MYYKIFKVKDRRLITDTVIAQLSYSDEGKDSLEVTAYYKDNTAQADLDDGANQFVGEHTFEILFHSREIAEWFLNTLTTESVTELIAKQSI